MKILSPIIEVSGRKYAFVEKHAEADALLAEARIAVPKIPKGFNTVVAHIHLRGHPALALNQTGFVRRASDNEEEVNGCSLLILMESTGDDSIDFGFLESALKTLTK